MCYNGKGVKRAPDMEFEPIKQFGGADVNPDPGSTRWWKLCVKKHNIVRGASYRD